MKTKIILSLAIVLFAGMAYAQVNLPINVSISVINWTGHAEVGSYAPQGTLYFKSGSISIDKGEITSGLLTLDMKSMKQENEHLLEHLKIGATNGAQSTAERLDDGAQRIYRNVAAEGDRAAKAIGRQIEEQPLVALLIALGIGYVGGRLLSR